MTKGGDNPPRGELQLENGVRRESICQECSPLALRRAPPVNKMCH